MALKDQISEHITPALHQAGYFLEDVNIVSPGQHRIAGTQRTNGAAPCIRSRRLLGRCAAPLNTE